MIYFCFTPLFRYFVGNGKTPLCLLFGVVYTRK